jgi:hypothetical protein
MIAPCTINISPLGRISILAYEGVLAGIHEVPLPPWDMGSLRSTDDDIEASTEVDCCLTWANAGETASKERVA